MERVFDVNFSPKVWDSEKLYTNFGDQPLKFRTENDLRKHCRETKLSSGALL